MARILVVDDGPMMRAMLRTALEADGHEVLEASNGLPVLMLVQERRCDLVILDIFMPFKDGIETIRDLRRGGHKVKIIAISGRGGRLGMTFLKAARDLGADLTLEKPFELAALRAALDELLSS